MKKILKSMLAVMIAAFTLASCSDVPSPYGLFFNESGEIEGAEGSGTIDDPYNVPAVINLVMKLGSDISSDEPVYIKGIVSQLVEGQNYDAGYGNGTFYISLDGTGKNQFLVYRALYLENKSYTAGPVANIGDEVVICGKVVLHNGNTPETVDKGAYLYSINGETSYDMPEFGTKDNPLSVADALEIIENLENNETAGNAYVKGKISKVDAFSSGKITYYISDDGQNSKTIQCYKGLGLNKAKFAAQSDLAAGDEVVVYGPLTKYVNNSGYVTPELNDGNYLISIVKGSGGGGGGSSTPSGDGTLQKPYNAAAAIDAVKNLKWTSNTDYESTDVVYVKGKISRIANKGTYTEGGTYGNASFYISDDGTESTEFYCFRVLYLNNTKFNEYTGDKVDIKVGDEVIVCGKLMNYQGNTPETVGNGAYLYSLNSGGGSGGGGDTPSSGNMTKSVNDLIVTFTAPNVTGGSTVEYDLTTCGLAHQTTNPSFQINGVTFAFDKNTGNTNAIYWKTGDYDEFRLYAQNKLTITGTSNIAKVVFQCTKNGSNNAVGNEQSYASVSGKTFTFVNDWTAPSSGTQCRIKKISITYAK